MHHTMHVYWTPLVGRYRNRCIPCTSLYQCCRVSCISRFGRRRPYYVAMALMISSAVFVSLSPNFIVYCILQFIVAVNTVACFATGVTIGDKQHSLSQQPLLSSILLSSLSSF